MDCGCECTKTSIERERGREGGERDPQQGNIFCFMIHGYISSCRPVNRTLTTPSPTDQKSNMVPKETL